MFYRSQSKADEREEIDALGTVVSINHTLDIDEAYSIANRRTVYSRDQIAEQMSLSKNGLTLITFDLLQYLDDPFTLEEMRKMGLEPPPEVDGHYKRGIQSDYANRVDAILSGFIRRGSLCRTDLE